MQTVATAPAVIPPTAWSKAGVGKKDRVDVEAEDEEEEAGDEAEGTG